MRSHGILIRHFNAPRISNYLRITIGTDAHTPKFVGMRARETQELLKSCGLNYVCTFEKKKPVFHKI